MVFNTCSACNRPVAMNNVYRVVNMHGIFKMVHVDCSNPEMYVLPGVVIDLRETENARREDASEGTRSETVEQASGPTDEPRVKRRGDTGAEIAIKKGSRSNRRTNIVTKRSRVKNAKS